MLRIGISGKMASGKTTLSERLQLYFNSNINSDQSLTATLSLAGPVKEVAKRYFLMPDDYKDRALLQQIGQQFRAIRPTVWVDLLASKAQTLEEEGLIECVVCDDIRFPNEVEMLQAEGWFIIRLEVNDEDRLKRIKRVYGSDWENHWDNRHEISETALDDFTGFDMVLDNPDLEAFDLCIEKLYSEIQDRPFQSPQA